MGKTSKNHNSSKSGGFLQPYRVIFRITLWQIFYSKKSLLTAILAILPVVISLLFRFSRHSSRNASSFFPMIMILMYLMFLTVLLALLYGTAIIADEVDNKTITYLFTRPIRKSGIILSKFAAYLLGSMVVLIPSALLTFLIIATDAKMRTSFADNLNLFFRYIGVFTLALIAYGSIFTFLGSCIKHSVLVGLFFVFGWEKITVVMPGLIKKFSVVHYLLSSFPHERIPREIIRGLFRGTTSRPVLSTIILFIISIAFLGLSIFTIYRKDFSKLD